MAWQNIALSLDLVLAAQNEYDFLQYIATSHARLYRVDSLRAAITRYYKWLELCARHPGKNLLPPLDVHWIWHAHMQTPSDYQTECTRTAGFLIDHTVLPLERLRGKSRSAILWTLEYTTDSYDYRYVRSAQKQEEQSQMSGREQRLLDLAQQMREFSYHTCLPHYRSQRFLETALQRYKKFLYLLRSNVDEQLVPCFDIALVWCAHRLHPKSYAEDLAKNNIRLTAKQETVMSNTPYSQLGDAWRETDQIWRKRFDEPMFVRGALYCGFDGPSKTAYAAPLQLNEHFDTCSRSLVMVKVRNLLAKREHQQNHAHLRLRVRAELADEKKKVLGTEIAKIAHDDDAPIVLRVDVPTDIKIPKECTKLHFKLQVHDFRKKSMVFIDVMPNNVPTYRGEADVTRRCRDRMIPLTLQQDSNVSSDELKLPVYLSITSTERAKTEWKISYMTNHFERYRCHEPTKDDNTDELNLYNVFYEACENKEGFLTYPYVISSKCRLVEPNAALRHDCMIVLSAPASLALILLLDKAKEILVSAQLIGAAGLPQREQLAEHERTRMPTREPNERALLVRNKVGDFAVLVGSWHMYGDFEATQEFRVVIYYLHTSGISECVECVTLNAKSKVLTFGGLNHKLKSIEFYNDSETPSEELVMTFGIGLLLNLCNPDKVRDSSPPLPSGVVPVCQWPIVQATGYGKESPSNKYLVYSRNEATRPLPTIYWTESLNRRCLHGEYTDRRVEFRKQANNNDDNDEEATLLRHDPYEQHRSRSSSTSSKDVSLIAAVARRSSTTPAVGSQ